MRILLFLGAVALGLVAAGPAAAQAAEAPPWTAWVGSQDGVPDWAGLVRGIGRGDTGVALDAAGAVDTATVERDLAELAGAIAPLVPGRDLILPVGGMGSGRQQENVDRYMALLARDAGRTWKQLVKRQALQLAGLPGSEAHLYWQLDNEINSRHFSLSLRTWAGAPPARGAGRAAGADEEPRADDAAVPRGERRSRGGGREDGEREHREGGDRNDPFIITHYAEALLAPSVEAIDAASVERFGRPGQIPIVLGTLANARSAAAQEWLDRLLAYRIEGRFAPSLAGRAVHELVDIIAIHYVVSYPGGEWRTILDDLHRRWVGKGRISGVWSTEEVGRRRALRGVGGSTALRVTFRYLDWAQEHRLSPRQTRVNFWGVRSGPAGTTVDEALSVLYGFLGKVPVERIAPNDIDVGGADAERYGIVDPRSGRKAILVFPDRSGGRLSLPRLRLREGGGGATAATVHRFTAQGRQLMKLDVRREGGLSVFTGGGSVELGEDDTALFLIEPGA